MALEDLLKNFSDSCGADKGSPCFFSRAPLRGFFLSFILMEITDFWVLTGRGGKLLTLGE